MSEEQRKTRLSPAEQIQREGGVATAAEGNVILDGPDGVAVTMTADAAAQTGEQLIRAAEEARRQGG